MENYKLATRKKLRFNTLKGLLTTEQLWDLSLNDLDSLAVDLDQEYKSSGKKSYLQKKSAKDQNIKLQFDIVVDILESKVEEKEEQANAFETKQYNSRILELIAKKKEESLENLSLEELEKMLK